MREYELFLDWKAQRSAASSPVVPPPGMTTTESAGRDVVKTDALPTNLNLSRLPPVESLLSPRDGSESSARGHNFRKASTAVAAALSRRRPQSDGSAPSPPIHTQVDVSDKPLYWKIFLLLLIPIIGLLVLSILSLIFTSNMVVATSQLEDNIKELLPVANYLHYLQLERGWTGMMLVANGSFPTLFRSEISKWRMEADGVLPTVRRIEEEKISTQSVSIQALTFRERLQQIPALRRIVDSGQASQEDVFSAYINITSALVKYMLQFSSVRYGTPNSFEELFTAFAATQIKENMGVERGLGAAAFLRGRFASEDQYFLFRQQVVESDLLLLKQVPAVASAAQRVLFNSFTESPSDVLSKSFVDVLLSRNFSSASGFDVAFRYFNIMTERVETLHVVELQLYDKVVATVDQQRSAANGQLAATVVILVLSGLATLLAGMWIFWTLRALDNMKSVLSKFLPAECLMLLGLDYGKIRLGDHASVDLAILFLDIRDFTTIAERLSGQECFDWLLHFTALLSPIVTANDGFIDKYMGDGIMAIFRKPSDAVQAAVLMVEAVKELNASDEVRRGDAFAFNVGVGIHYGPVVIGTMGDDIRYDVAIVSDAVNLASRLEGLSKVYGCHILVSQDVMDHLSDRLTRSLHIQRLGRAKVRGRIDCITVYDVFEADDDVVFGFKNANKERFEQAGILFEQGDFASAFDISSKLCQQYEEVVCAVNDKMNMVPMPGLNFFGGGRPYLFRSVESQKLSGRKRVGQDTFFDDFCSK